MLGALSVTETVSWGILYYAFTVFIKPMQAELGWSRGEMTGAFSVALVIAGLAGVPVGRWLDRHGTRALMGVGSIAATALVLGWAAVDNLLVFYLLWAGIGLTMAAVLYDPAFVAVAVWFRRRRGRALTILTFVAGFASVIFIPLAQWLVQQQGWRMALVTLAIILGVITIPLHWLALRRHPHDLGLLPDGDKSEARSHKSEEERQREFNSAFPTPNPQPLTPAIEKSVTLAEAMRGSAFWWLAVAFTLNTLSLVAVTVHLVPYLGDKGYDSRFAAAMVGLIGVMGLPGRIVFNLLAEHWPRRWLSAFIFMLQGTSLVVLLLWQDIAGVWVFVALFGAGFGAITPLRAGLTAELYGPAYYGQIAGVLGLFVTAARGLGPVGAGISHDLLGNYVLILWILAGVSFASAGAISLVHSSHDASAQ
jgi:sugar phosphate permease